MNENLKTIIARQVRDIRSVFEINEQLARQFPQLNSKTTIRLTNNPSEWIADSLIVDMRTLEITYNPAPGLVAWLQRLRGRVHKWFVENQYHPGERPKNWKPYQVRIGMRAMSPVATSPNRREIRLQAYGWEVAEEPYLSLYQQRQKPTNRFYITCGYDALTDTLFVRA